MITVKFFAGFREKLGKGEMLIDVDGVSVEDLLELLDKEHPGIKDLIADKRATIAINRKVAKLGDVVREGDTVAVFPPVSGG